MQAREIHEEKPNECRFYLISIPELSTFFVAHGYFNEASIAGLSRVRLKHMKSCGLMLDNLLQKVSNQGLDLSKIRSALGSSRA